MGRLTLIPRRPTGRVVASGGLIAARYPLIGFGPELNPDPLFGNPGLWTLGDGWSIDQNVAKLSGVQADTSHLQISNLLEPFTLYRMLVTFSAISAGNMRQAAGSQGLGEWQQVAIDELVEFLDPSAGVLHLRVSGDLNGIGDVTRLSCRRVLTP